MALGIPARKAIFSCLSGDRCIDVCLVGATMYVLYSLEDDWELGVSSYLKTIDLDHFDGIFECGPNDYKVQASSVRKVTFSNGHLLITGAMPEVLPLGGAAPVYSEVNCKIHPDWGERGWVYYWKGLVYRGFSLDAPHKGVYVVDPVRSKVLRHLSLDIPYSKSWDRSFLFGERRNGNFLIYCLDREQAILDVSLARYRQGFSNTQLTACIEADLAYVIAGGHLLVFDLVTASLVREINYLNFPELQAHILKEGICRDWVCASNLSVCDQEVVLTHASAGGYALYLAPFRDEPFVWFWSAGWGVNALNCSGDLVFGLTGTRPIAWDKYTGGVVWEVTKPTSTNSISVGEKWVVFSQTSEYLQGYHCKKPYISPHRPVKEK
ncbi:hypothetical protein [Atopomonas sediminilitoris]|uniref:hypothetical protein n=1 Tax=Atopomonas sediminilitoris TaxID=2919919 RepID=UPI001F4EED98|nr:hypothetical protein [Atopomonas sediminilitoris]MCJ8169302.1 hypothetical protein [Atopomonas sediminilitoris]